MACPKKFKTVGKIADDVKGILFTAKAGESFEKAKRDFDSQVKRGIMTEEQRDVMLEILRKKLKKSVNVSVKKQERLEKEECKRRLMKKYGHKPKS